MKDDQRFALGFVMVAGGLLIKIKGACADARSKVKPMEQG